MEILIIICLAVLTSVFIVKFCIKGEPKRTEKDSGAWYYNVEIEDKTEEAEKRLEISCHEKEHKEKDVPVKTGIVYGMKSVSASASVSSAPQKAMEIKAIYQYIPAAYGWRCSYCDGINNDSEKRCQVCGMER